MPTEREKVCCLEIAQLIPTYSKWKLVCLDYGLFHTCETQWHLLFAVYLAGYQTAAGGWRKPEMYGGASWIRACLPQCLVAPECCQIHKADCGPLRLRGIHHYVMFLLNSILDMQQMLYTDIFFPNCFPKQMKSIESNEGSGGSGGRGKMSAHWEWIAGWCWSRLMLEQVDAGSDWCRRMELWRILENL